MDKLEIIRIAENAMLWLENAERAVIDAKEDIEKLIAWCRQGPPGAQVDKVEVKWEEYKGEFDSFSVTW